MGDADYGSSGATCVTVDGTPMVLTGEPSTGLEPRPAASMRLWTVDQTRQFNPAASSLPHQYVPCLMWGLPECCRAHGRNTVTFCLTRPFRVAGGKPGIVYMVTQASVSSNSSNFYSSVSGNNLLYRHA